jgi:hypothetical protein
MEHNRLSMEARQRNVTPIRKRLKQIHASHIHPYMPDALQLFNICAGGFAGQGN